MWTEIAAISTSTLAEPQWGNRDRHYIYVHSTTAGSVSTSSWVLLYFSVRARWDRWLGWRETLGEVRGLMLYRAVSDHTQHIRTLPRTCTLTLWVRLIKHRRWEASRYSSGAHTSTLRKPHCQLPHVKLNFLLQQTFSWNHLHIHIKVLPVHFKKMTSADSVMLIN